MPECEHETIALTVFVIRNPDINKILVTLLEEPHFSCFLRERQQFFSVSIFFYPDNTAACTELKAR